MLEESYSPPMVLHKVISNFCSPKKKKKQKIIKMATLGHFSQQKPLYDSQPPFFFFWVTTN